MSNVLLTSVVETPADPGSVAGVGVTRVSISGERHAACIAEAVAAAYPRLDDSGPGLRALDGKKVTILRYGENMLGAGMIFTEEGTLFNGGFHPASEGQAPQRPPPRRRQRARRGSRLQPRRARHPRHRCAGAVSPRSGS